MTLHALESRITRLELERILRVWQERLRLTHWAIEIDWGMPLDDDEANAEILIEDFYDAAKVRIANGFPAWSADWANKVIVHELLHVVCRDMDELVKAVKVIVPDERAHDLFADRYNHEAEGVVDRLAITVVLLAGNA